MKVYFYSKEKVIETERKKIQQTVVDDFYKNGVLVLSNFMAPTTDSQLSFVNMDGLVIEGADVVSEVGYLIAKALSQKKPILYLLPKGTVLPDQLRDLTNDNNLKKFFILKFYNLKNINNLLLEFIDIIETGELRKEVPTIKFTLRFTPRAERYLRWKTHNTKVSKADFLRNLIDASINSDENYQKNLRSQRKTDNK